MQWVAASCRVAGVADGFFPRARVMGLAAFAAMATVLIVVIGAVAGYVDNYYTKAWASGWPTISGCGFIIICTVSR